MNKVPSYTLASDFETGPFARALSDVARGLLGPMVLSAEFAVIVAMSCIAGIGYHWMFLGELGDVRAFLAVGALAGLIFVIPRAILQRYQLRNLLVPRPGLRRDLVHWSATCLCLLVLAFLTKTTDVYSRGWFVLYFGLTAVPIVVVRRLLVHAVARASRSGVILPRRVYLVGAAQKINAFVNRYQPWNIGINIVGCRFLRLLPADAPPGDRHDMLQQELSEALDSARFVEPDAVFVLLPWSDIDAIDQCAEQFLSLPVEIHLGPEKILDRFGDSQLSDWAGMPTLQLTRHPLTRFETIQKRLLDIVVASAALIALTPLLLAIMILIKLDSAGPVFFLQRRSGFNQREFRIIKFRTMTTLDDGDVVRQATRNDPRVTRTGRWLRRWNLDEVPQLFNVLIGDMSLVGPRPHALTHNHVYERRIALYARRHNVKPGITGWAQISGFRGETDTDDKMRGRVRCDLHYIDNWSIWLDLRILLKTLFSPLAYRNAQ